MKYWFFDGSDVTGPFSLKELTQNKAFSENSLVCPENFSDDGDHWQVAATFDELKPLFAPQREEKTTTLEQEMDTLLNERSPLAFDETPSEGPGLQIPKKPAKPGPIEDYFNQVKEEDLGDILGIPNPNEDSDMDLAHALEKQLAKTSSTRRRERELENETDEQTAAELAKASQTHHVATATEVFATRAPMAQAASATPTATAVAENALAKELTMPLVEPPTMPTLTPDPVSAPTTPQPAPAQPISNEPQELVTQAPADTTPVQPTATVAPQEPQPVPQIVPDPAQLRREKVEVNSIRARLKQTQEMKDFLHETQNHRLKQEARTHNRVVVMLLTLLAIIGGLLLAFQLRTSQTASTTPQVAVPVSTAQELLTETPTPAPLPTATLEPSAPTATTPEQKALNIVKNHLLSDKRGTLANYLNRIYQSQLAQGYSGTWAAEPLYKNTYIVKYRLTKTRKEPIIYVFQADVAQGKLTGALNNISLDLVGKL